MSTKRPRSILPGFGLSMGFTVAYLGVIVIFPLIMVFFKASGLGWSGFWQTLATPRVLSACRLSFGLALLAGLLNGVFGLMIAWVLTRYRFPGRRFLDASVDLPFAMPTAVAGIALTALYAPNGWLGSLVKPYGIKIAFAPAGILIALVFIGLPFVVRTLQPVLEDFEIAQEEAAASLGATRWQTFRRVVFPQIVPPSSRAPPWPSRGPSGNTAPSSSSPATCPVKPKSSPCSSSPSSSSSTIRAPPPSRP